jgi:hypothetical protein
MHVCLEKASLHEVIKLSPHDQRRSSAKLDQQELQQQQQQLQQQQHPMSDHHAMESQTPEMPESIQHRNQKSIFFSSRPRDRHRALVDDFSLIFFPSLFLLFNLAYWTVVLVGSSHSRGVTPEQMNPWEDLDRLTREVHIQD